MLKELLYRKTRCYLLENGNQSLLVDTDWAGTLPLFFRALKEAAVPLRDIRYLLLTHCHPDHMGLAPELMRLGVQLVLMDVQLPYVHFSDRIYAKARNTSFTPIDETQALVLSCEASRAFLVAHGIQGEVLHTPGHSEDSISLLLDDGTAIVGDLPPLSTLTAYDDQVLRDSYQKLLSRGAKRLCYGHAPGEWVDGKA